MNNIPRIHNEVSPLPPVSEEVKKSEMARFLLYAFPTIPTIDGKLSGGLPAVIASEIRRRASELQKTSLNIISTDKQDKSYPDSNAEIIAAEQELSPNFQKYKVWFDEEWAIYHPEGYLYPNLPAQILPEIYRGTYQNPLTSREISSEHLEKFGVIKNGQSTALQEFTGLFKHQINKVPINSILSWQDFFFIDAISSFSSDLSSRGVTQTYHLHTNLPSNLHESERGIRILKAMNSVDKVYLHTDEYRRRYLRSLELAGIEQNSEVERFDLGIDIELMENSLNQIDLNNFTEHQDASDLSDSTKEVMIDIFKTQGKIPHRFISIDRIDPIKGSYNVIKAIENFLDGIDLSISEKEKLFRFYLVCYPDQRLDIEDLNVSQQYAKVTSELMQKLANKYPNIVKFSKSIPRAFIPNLLVDANLITGGVQDGLNLACQESFYVNSATNSDAIAIAGLGTGFAIQTAEDFPELKGIFPNGGDINELTKAIQSAVETKKRQPGKLRELSAKITNEIIIKRTAKMIED